MEPPELTPAEFDGVRRNRYRPRLPWARIGFVVLVAALIAGAYFWRQKVRADGLRERIQARHAERVAPILDALEATRIDLEAKALESKPGAANRLVQAEVPLSALHDKEVVYLRVRAPELRADEALRAAIESEEEDAVGACLGLELTPLAALSDVPEVLTVKWLDRVNDTNDMQRLSVREEQLTRAIERELPTLKERVPADYFLLLVVAGQDPPPGPGRCVPLGPRTGQARSAIPHRESRAIDHGAQPNRPEVRLHQSRRRSDRDRRLLDRGSHQGTARRADDGPGNAGLTVCVCAYSIRSSQRSVSGVRALGAMTDISNQKALELERARADRLASVGLLAAGVAHDFNNLLMGVTLATNLLADSVPPNTRQRRLTDDIMKACGAMATLAGRMLTFSRGGQPELQPVDLAKLVRESAELATSGSKVSLELALPREPVLVMVDPAQIGQAVNNIVINAVQAMPEGGHIEIGLGLRAPPAKVEAGASKWIEITITDTGPGIDEDILPNISELYFTTRDEGHGLGLAVASSILERHEGTLEVRSQLGEGTTFTLGLPHRTAPQLEAESPLTSRKDHSGVVLLVDDDDTARQAICAALEHLGFRVTEAANGVEAISRYTEANEAKAPFSVALIDLTLRGSDDGATVAGQLREIDSRTPMILMSGYGEKTALLEFRRHGFVAKLRKPFDLDALSHALDQARDR